MIIFFSIYTMITDVDFYMHYLGTFFHNIYLRIFSIYTMYTNYLIKTFKYILFTDVMLVSLGATIWGTPDVGHGG